MQRMALTTPSGSLLRALFALLPYAALVSSGGAEGVSTIPRPFPSFSAWVVPLTTNRLRASRGTRSPSYPQRDSGESSSFCRCDMSSPGHGSNNGGGGGGSRGTGNQGTGGRGRNSNNNNSRRSADEGIGNLDGSGSSSSNSGGGGGSSGGGKSNNKPGSNASKNADGGGGGDGGVDSKSGGGSAIASLERQFSQPAAPRESGISEGLGKGVPSPTQRLRLQQENLEMRWNMSKKRNQTICCRQCAGEGVEECRFCAGTGLFKIGSELIVDPESGRPPPCPVCRSKGEEVCSRCNGAGRIASWLFKSERRKWEESDGSSPPPPSPEADKR